MKHSYKEVSGMVFGGGITAEAGYPEFLARFTDAVQVHNFYKLNEIWNLWVENCPLDWKDAFEDDATILMALRHARESRDHDEDVPLGPKKIEP